MAGALPDHRRERLYPQQLRGSIRLHPGRRVNPFILSLFAPSRVSVFHQVHERINAQMLDYCFYYCEFENSTQRSSPTYLLSCRELGEKIQATHKYEATASSQIA